MSTKNRIWLVVLTTVASFIVLSSVALYQSNTFMMYLLRDKIQSLTESTIGIADALNDKVVAGTLTLEEAKKDYAEILHLMRYNDGKEFFFAVDYQGTFVAMGGAPNLVGENIINLKDSVTGNPMTRDFITLAKNGGGFYDHYWPKAGMETPEPKVAYVTGYEPWKMYVGTGLYFDNINQLYKEFAIELGLVVTLLALIMTGALYIVSRGIFSRINWIKRAMNDVASGNADLRARLSADTKDEFSEVADSFNIFIAQVQSIIRSVRESSAQVNLCAQKMADSAAETTDTIQSQLHETELASTAINEMSATIQEIAQTANTTSGSTKTTAVKAEDGSAVVSQAISSVHHLGEEISVATGHITELRNRSDDIGTILEVIKEIADQTNLLALNAAIEAARAGEMGRGFAVVADEVRNLARRTQESTTEIESIISYLQSASVNAHESMHKSLKKMKETREFAENSGSALEVIKENTLQVSDMNIQVATATDQQSVVAEEINKNVMAIHSKNQVIAGNAEAITSHSETLQAMSVRLEQELKKFTV